MLAVIVRFVVKKPYYQRFAERVEQQALNSLAHEPDCRQFDVCVDVANPGRVLLYEIYTDADAFARHLAAPYFHAFNMETSEWIESKEVEQWHRQER